MTNQERMESVERDFAALQASIDAMKAELDREENQTPEPPEGWRLATDEERRGPYPEGLVKWWDAEKKKWRDSITHFVWRGDRSIPFAVPTTPPKPRLADYKPVMLRDETPEQMARIVRAEEVLWLRGDGTSDRVEAPVRSARACYVIPGDYDLTGVEVR